MELESHQSELAAFESGSELLALQRNLADQRVSGAEDTLAAWSTAAPS
ncbi:MAG: hypothetical protein ACI841_003581, partial [Planctomycetota bacterium]